jgi:hypothetical protein
MDDGYTGAQAIFENATVSKYLGGQKGALFKFRFPHELRGAF